MENQLLSLLCAALAGRVQERDMNLRNMRQDIEHMKRVNTQVQNECQQILEKYPHLAQKVSSFSCWSILYWHLH